ncbi:hypothetical protein F5Y10DRAFT_285671 [Nemania abortiva]|nr:hypothetical protein F5Y10DRAFT_285671 [Nemania abortiva]
MAEPQNGTLTVPVGTRLSQGIELEFLVAFVDTNEIDPDEADAANLAPLLQIDNVDQHMIDDTLWEPLEEHIRGTLRNHGIRVRSEFSLPPRGVPLHLAHLDQWDVTSDGSVTEGPEEDQLSEGKAGQYRWYPIEVRSPACWDDPRAFDEIRYVVNLLKSQYRIRVNPSCGFHVHVGNGPAYFKPETLKRTGAFLWAADPMLSRLHAPYRRVTDFASSFRYTSRLASWEGMTSADAEMIIDQFSSRDDPDNNLNIMRVDAQPILPWSDSSREEADFGDRANWEQYASARVRDGPHMTLDQGAPRPMFSPTPPPSEHGGPTPPGSDSSSSSDSDNEGGAYQRRLSQLMQQSEFRQRCMERYGHAYPEALSRPQLFTLIIIDQCHRLYGHTDVESVSNEEFYRAVIGMGPYVENIHTRWEWDENTNELGFSEAMFGAPLQHTQPQRVNRLNVASILKSLDQLAADDQDAAAARAAAGNDNGNGDGNGNNNRGGGNGGGGGGGGINDDLEILENLFYDRLNQLLDQPSFPLGNVDRLVRQWTENRRTGQEAARRQAAALARMQEEVTTAAAAAAAATAGGGGGGDDGGDGDGNGDGGDNGQNRTPSPSSSSSGSNSDSDSDSDGGFNPAAFDALRGRAASTEGSQHSEDLDSSPLVSNPSSGNQNNNNRAKLHPHDISQLPADYINNISVQTGLHAPDWARIPWLPRPGGGGGGPPDPLEPHQRGGPDCDLNGRIPGRCLDHVLTDTRAGIAAILSLESAGAVGAMVNTWNGGRSNYNFAAYDLDIRHIDAKRTIEFREAAGTLDADLIVLWSKICIGIMRFCRDANAADFLTVLERVVREEERQRFVDPQADDNTMYDVCDLLEDICLFAEAATVRRFEQNQGPPR